MVSAAGVVVLLWRFILGLSEAHTDQDKQLGWYGVMVASCRKPVEHHGIFDDVASNNADSTIPMDSIKVCPDDKSCQGIAEVVI